MLGGYGAKCEMPVYTKPERVLLKGNPEYNEKWIQDCIAQDPAILGLGDLVLRDRERIQPRAGRLDLLLQDPDTKRRYEVELQLGATDESHIIRTIEYWDIERKRYPQYDHSAVIVAEDITSRFLNVISLFNGSISLIAIQMQAFRIAEHTTLVFTTVVDELSRGLVDEDEEEATTAPTDRAYWETRGSKATIAVADQLLTVLKEFDPSLELKYNKFYVGLAKDGQVDNFVSFRPRKNTLILDIKLPQSEDIDKQVADAGLDTLEYDIRGRKYPIRLDKGDVVRHAELLKSLMRRAYDTRHG
jgi:predicted transport protein